MAGSGVGFALARAASIDGVVALTALAAAAALLAAERPADGERTTPADRWRRSRLPEMAHDLAEGVLLFDAAGRLADWNPAARATFDLRPAAAGTALGDLLEPILSAAAWTTLPSEAGEAIRSRATLDGEAPRELTLVHARDGTALLVARDLALERNETTEAARLARELRGTIEELLEARQAGRAPARRDRARRHDRPAHRCRVAASDPPAARPSRWRRRGATPIRSSSSRSTSTASPS